MRASDESSSPRSRRGLYLALVGLLWAVRGLFVVSLCDVFFYGEELAKGAAGKALLAGLELAHAQRGYLYYEGGGFVISHLDALAFWLVGPNILALKLVALGVSTLVLLASVRLTDELFGRRAAFFFGLLFVFAPSSFQRLSLLALGIHFEALFFVALALLLAARLCAAPVMRAPAVAWLGVVAGFGCFFSYSCALVVAYCAGTLLLSRPRETLRVAPAGLAGFALGFAPWIWTYAHVGSEILDIHGERLVAGEQRGLVALLAQHLRAVYSSGSVEALAFGLLAMACAGALASAWRRSTVGLLRWPSLWLAVYVVAFLAVYAWTGLAEERLELFFHVKRLSQPWLLATILGAAFLAHTTGTGRAWVRRLSWVMLTLWLAAGASASAHILRTGRPGDWSANWEPLRRLRGYAWTAYLKNVEPRLAGDWRARMRSLERLGEHESEHFDPALAAQLLRTHFGEIELEELIAVAPPGRRDAFLRGAGAWWERRHGRDLTAQRTALAGVPEAWRAPLSEAMGRQSLATFVNPQTVRRAVGLGQEHSLDDEFFIGVGYRLSVSLGGDFGSGRGLARCMRPLVFHPELVPALVGDVESEILDLLTEGYARALRDRALP